MKKPMMLWVDQWGNRWYARTVKDLCLKVGYTKARRMYVDGTDEKSYHVGYVIGPHWINGFSPMRKEVE